MKGLSLFAHSLKLVVRNLAMAMRLSFLPFIIVMLAQFWMMFELAALAPSEMPVNSGAFPWIPAALFFLSALVCYPWIAVVWHRFVLLEEYETGLIPTFNRHLIASYLGRSILIGLVMIAVVVAAVIVLVVAVPILAPRSLQWPYIFEIFAEVTPVLLGSYLLFRLGVVLPAAALNKELGLWDAWHATKGNTGAIVLLAGMSASFNWVTKLPLPSDLSTWPLHYVAYDAITGWLMVIISISILTTLYGHYVEGREIG